MCTLLCLFLYLKKKGEDPTGGRGKPIYLSLVLLLSISDRCSPAGLFTLHGERGVPLPRDSLNISNSTRHSASHTVHKKMMSIPHLLLPLAAATVIFIYFFRSIFH